ncbi:MAG: PQQ-dependent sugar dehydrogenase [Longimicrobiaceae bacterium]
MNARLVLLLGAGVLAGCAAEDADGVPPRTDGPPHSELACDADNGGLTLPDGFCAAVFADEVGALRHIAVAPDGRVYGALRTGGVVGLADSDGDGKADRRVEFGGEGGTGISVRDGYLYFATNDQVIRYRLGEQLEPTGEPETMVGGFPAQRTHAAKTIAFDGVGNLYVNVGAPSNACQERDRQQGAPGTDPCPQLELHAGVWRYDAGQPDQSHAAGNRYATGIRNAVAIAWSDAAGSLFVVQHGRDQLNTIAPEHFSDEDNAELPAEEFMKVGEGDDFGWPYCFYDQRQGKRVLAPEYGGDGREVGNCASFAEPVETFPGHWAPNGLTFYDGDLFPERYRGGAFIAWHGSWNRAPLPQRGYRVTFVPLLGGEPSGEPETFADGFAGAEPISSPSDARWRPMGLAVAPNGSLYISDSQRGRVWRVVYRGEG